MCTCFSVCFGNSEPYRYGFLFLKTYWYVFINFLCTEYFENIPAWFHKKETIPVCFQLRPPANFTSTLNVICDVVSWRRSMKFTYAIDRHILQRRTKFDVNTSRDVEVIDVQRWRKISDYFFLKPYRYAFPIWNHAGIFSKYSVQRKLVKTYRYAFRKRKPYRYVFRFPNHTEKPVHMTSLAILDSTRK